MPFHLHNLFAATALSLLLGGCTPSTPTDSPSPHPSASAHDHDHEHGHTAPHGGGLTAVGKHAAHLEVCLDPASGTVDLYLLDGEAEKAIRAEPAHPLQLKLNVPKTLSLTLEPVADPLSSETETSTSHFRASSPDLKSQIQLEGTLDEVELQGQSYTNLKLVYPGGIPH